MYITMNFEGYVGEIIDRAVKKGIVKTKAEALRLGLLELNNKYQLVLNSEEIELKEDLREIDRIEKDIKSGKEKLHKARNVEALFK
jgi:Arc/MetJ-type ribon-helix-helix transcriptional regulator